VEDVHRNLTGFVEDFVKESTTMRPGIRSLLRYCTRQSG
jgi:hypothetical protein